jgi:hypothetical protein
MSISEMSSLKTWSRWRCFWFCVVAGDGARVLAAGEVVEAHPLAAEAADQVVAVPAAQVGDGADADLGEGLLAGRAEAPDDAHGFGGEEVEGFRPADDGKALRLVHVGGHLGEELVVGQADGAGDAELGLHAFHEAGEQDGRRLPVQPRGAGEVEEGLVEGQGFDGRRQVLHHGADLAADLDIDVHAAAHDDGLGAEFERLEHRHGGAHALDPRDVAGGGDDAAASAADDDGLVAELGIVAFLDRGVEGVAIHMGDGEIEELGMRVTRGLPQAGQRGSGVEGGQAISAERGHVRENRGWKGAAEGGGMT